MTVLFSGTGCRLTPIAGVPLLPSITRISRETLRFRSHLWPYLRKAWLHRKSTLLFQIENTE
jgi:hypothetical protein